MEKNKKNVRATEILGGYAITDNSKRVIIFQYDYHSKLIQFDLYLSDLVKICDLIEVTDVEELRNKLLKDGA